MYLAHLAQQVGLGRYAYRFIASGLDDAAMERAKSHARTNGLVVAIDDRKRVWFEKKGAADGNSDKD